MGGMVYGVDGLKIGGDGGLVILSVLSALQSASRGR